NYISPNSTGTLTFAPGLNRIGSAVLVVTVSDGQATTTRSFNVTVNQANQAPTLDPLNKLNLVVNSGQQVVNLTGISAGTANEKQPLTVTATSSDPNIIPNPVLNYNSPNSAGYMVISPVANATGNVTITVKVDDGQSAN